MNTPTGRGYASGKTVTSIFIGRAAEDKSKDSVELEVIIPQLMPAAEGAMAPTQSRVTFDFQTGDGSKNIASANISNTISARWIGKSNVKYPPMVRKGEQVIVTQYGDSDLYYWESTGRDPELRKGDIFRVEVSGKTSANESLSDENTYFFELNSIDKSVTIRTSMKNGEITTYFMKFDAAGGLFTVTDNFKNSITFDSPNNKVTVMNGDKSSVILDKRTAIVAAPDDVVLKAGRQIVLDAPTTTMRTVNGDSTTVLDVGSATIKASGILTLQGQGIGLNGPVEIDGPVKVGGLVLADGFGNGTSDPYTDASTDISTGAGTAASGGENSGNAEVGGAARHAAAMEQMVEMASIITAYFDEVQASIGVPLDTSAIVPKAEESEMTKITGD